MSTDSGTPRSDIHDDIYMPSDAELLRLRDEAAALRADRNALAEALRPFAAMEPSSLYAPDGSDDDAYQIFLTAHPDKADFMGRDLYVAKQALANHGGTNGQ